MCLLTCYQMASNSGGAVDVRNFNDKTANLTAINTVFQGNEAGTVSRMSGER